MEKKFYYLLAINILLMSAVIFFSFSRQSNFPYLETKELIIRNDDKSASIFLRIEKNNPQVTLLNKNNVPIAKIGKEGNGGAITLFDQKGLKRVQMEANPNPIISLYDEKDRKGIELQLTENKDSNIVLCDKNAVPRLELHANDNPSIYLKNKANQTIGSLTVLQDGGAGFGLAEANGIAATILRGGTSPGLSFYSGYSNEPSAVIGVSNQIPHILVSGQKENEGILIHGGQPSGMMVVDEFGKLKIFISKHGVFQGKEASIENKEKPKFFSYEEDFSRLFPDRAKR
jgi:hypothetical protein